jgi:hypothetical protein
MPKAAASKSRARKRAGKPRALARVSVPSVPNHVSLFCDAAATDAVGINFLCNFIVAAESNEYPAGLAKEFLESCAAKYEKLGGDGTFEKVPDAIRAVAFNPAEITAPRYRLASLTAVEDFRGLYSIKRLLDAAKSTKRKSHYDKLFTTLPPGGKVTKRLLARARQFAGELILRHGFELGGYGLFWASRMADPCLPPDPTDVDACNHHLTQQRSSLGLSHLEKGDLVVEVWIQPSVGEMRAAGVRVARPVAVDAVDMKAYRHRSPGDVCPYPDGWGRAVDLIRFCSSEPGSTGGPEVVLGPVRDSAMMSVGSAGQISTMPFYPLNQAKFLILLAESLSSSQSPLDIAKQAALLCA